MDHAKTDLGRPLRWFQFSLKTLVMTMVMCALVFSLWRLWMVVDNKPATKAATPAASTNRRQQFFDQFADSTYAFSSTRAQVFEMLGPPTETIPPEEGFAELHTWRESFGVHDYRLSLYFGSNGDVIAFGLWVDGEEKRR